MKSVLLSAVTFIAGSTQAFADFLPKNDLAKYDNMKNLTGINKSQFVAAISEVKANFNGIIADHGAKLEIVQKWNDSTVNASATQIGNRWIVNMYGGLARRPEITRDGFSLVICHELGHHIAGYPTYDGLDDLSSEGQSDYFSTQACARRMWRDQATLNETEGNKATPTAKAFCARHYSDENELNLCRRIAAAGQSLASLLATLNKERIPNAGTPDNSRVGETKPEHPKGQCRLDTYLHGAVCKVEFDFSLIPGKNLPQGSTAKDAQEEAYRYSCAEGEHPAEAVRPRCWFKPVSNFKDVELVAK